MIEVLHTKWGTAKLNNRNYYQISTTKEGNSKKYLHRLIYEEFWGVKLPTEIHIHHKDGNKLNNCILNLEALTPVEHYSKHKGENHPMYGRNLSEETKKKISESRKGEKHPLYGKHHSKETRQKISKSQNTTGYFRVTKQNTSNCKQGFIWQYSYCVEGKQKAIRSVDINKLKEKVISKGLEWRKYK